MFESLLSFSEVLLFGRKLNDLAIVPAHEAAEVLTKSDLPNNPTPNVEVEGTAIGIDKMVLLKHKDVPAKSGLFKLQLKEGTDPAAPAEYEWENILQDKNEYLVSTPRRNDPGRRVFWRVRQKNNGNWQIRRRKLGNTDFLGGQLDEDACFARIYGFSFEGDYFDLPSPTLFLVHGDGELVSQVGKIQQSNDPSQHARAPREPSVGGMGAANFQFADDIRVWGYDKADYTIRMDVCTGMFEQVLLDATLGDDGFGISGAKVSGAKVSGAKVSGAKVSGAKVSGAKVSGAKARGPSD